MSILTDVAVRATLEDFTKARDETLKLLGEGLRLCQMARECSEKHVRYGFPTDVIPRIGLAQATKEIDARWWRYCFTATGLMKIMDAKVWCWGFGAYSAPMRSEVVSVSVRSVVE